MAKKEKTHISRPCRYYNFDFKLPETRFAPDALQCPHRRTTPLELLCWNWENQTDRFFKHSLSVASRELPAVAAVHALAECGHRLIGGAGLGLCVGDLGLLAFAACHPVREKIDVSAWKRRQGNFFLNARKTPYRTHSHRSRG
jgi:hypothetical protein